MVVGIGAVGPFLNITMLFEFPIFIGIEFHSFARDIETAFCLKSVLRYTICTSEQFLVILCDTFGGQSYFFSHLNLLQHGRFYTLGMPHLAARCY